MNLLAVKMEWLRQHCAVAEEYNLNIEFYLLY
jgi:hypothetical protein